MYTATSFTLSSPEPHQPAMNPVSLFNDVIGPVMRGPSSSHCAAALRIGRLARDLMQGEIQDVLVEFDENGSLPATHESQGSDMGLFGGLLGWNADDPRLPESAAALQAAGITLKIITIAANDSHPNTYRLALKNATAQHSLIAISTGGGMIEVISIDGVPLSMDGGYHETLLWYPKTQLPKLSAAIVHTHDLGHAWLVHLQDDHFHEPSEPKPLATRHLAPVLPVPSRPNIVLPFRDCKSMLAWDGEQNTPLHELALRYECDRGALSREDVRSKMRHIVDILETSIRSGLAGTSYTDRVLHSQSPLFNSALQHGRLLNAGALNQIILNVSAMMEVKSSMGVIVAAPTAGACAALPGSVIGMADFMGKGIEAKVDAFLAAGLIGIFIATRWTFAAEVGGCQAEGGSASAMAAAALVTLANGTRNQAVAAASMALQNTLGLICDPIANRVEAPCLGKNLMAASNALTCANIALAGFDPLIPLDEVIDAAKAVSDRMPREHRCTSLGGLAATPTSRTIEARLTAAKSRSCAACHCG